MRAYFGSRISDHMIETPEGYLVCKDVPIARTGIQQYRGMEFGGDDPNKIYSVERPEEEVFQKAALASFEGKPVVDEHPAEDVLPENVLKYLKGTCRNVHRGEGALLDCIVADLIIYDPGLMEKIRNGKRDISCGYDCLWVPTGDDSYTQKEIRGNHVAVVERGRAGHKVSIRDSKKGMKRMRNDKKNLWGRILAAFAKDEDTTPEDIAAAAKLNPDAHDAAPEPTPASLPQAPRDPQPQTASAFDAAALNDRMTKIEDAISSLSQMLQKQQAPQPPQKEPDALDALENELNGKPPVAPKPQPDPNDDGYEVPPQDINRANGEADDDGEEVIEPNDREGNEPPQGAKDAALEIIDGLKPVLASLPQGERKRASDSMAALLRLGLGSGSAFGNSQYGTLARMQRNGHRAKDSMSTIMNDDAYGRLIREKYNPHYQNKED